MNPESTILVEAAGGVAVIQLNRPAAYNAINLAMGDELLDALIRCDEDPAIRAVVITGKGSAFCAGGDLRQMVEHAGPDGGSSEFLKKLTVRFHAIIATMAHMPKPVITAVNGAAAGGGFSLAIAGDLVVAAHTAKFTVAYSSVALAPDGSSTFFLPRLIGPKRAYELICNNRAIPAHEAQSMGLINQVFPADGFAERAREYAATLANGPTFALAQAKKLLALTWDSSLETQMEHERQAIAACGKSDDFRTRVQSFLSRGR